jgi:Do/DeqQ family serine protease
MKNPIIVLFTAFLSGFLGAYVYLNYFSNSIENSIHVSQSPQFVHYSGTNLDSEVSFVNASAASTGSVVYIKTSTAQQIGYNWFDYFFYGTPQTQTVISSGSGVIYTKDGYIITNNHVIANADKIEVIHAKKSYIATLIGTDPSTDLAILKIDGVFPAINIGSSRSILVGDWVLAVGNPFNLESTVTAGIVSAKGRNINILKDRFPIESFIQTDAAINPGNSGGALVNLKGELVGINTAILSQTGSYAGYGFAVPVDIARKVADDIIKYGEVQKAFLGADIAEVDASIAEKFNLKEISGVMITNIIGESAADKVGIKKGDIIIAIDGVEIDSKSSFDEQLSYHRPGDKIKLIFKRNDKTIEASLTLSNKEGTTELIKKEVFFSKFLGAELEPVSKIEKSRIGINSGVRVIKLSANGLLPSLGLEAGFIITAVNNKPMEKPAQLLEILENIRGRVVIQGISSNGQKGYYQFIF